jgi:hypothetical protein
MSRSVLTNNYSWQTFAFVKVTPSGNVILLLAVGFLIALVFALLLDLNQN